MPVRIVQSKHNARLKELRRALSAPTGSRPELVGIEGPNLVGEALRAGRGIACVFVAQGAEGLLEGLTLPAGTEVLALPEILLKATLTTETPQPLAALVEPPQWTWEQVLGHGRNRPALVVVMAGLQDPGNLGTILRSAEAFGATGVVSLPGTVSLWNPKVLRASAGSLFRLPALVSSVQKCFLRLGADQVRVWATDARRGTEAQLADLAAPMAFLIGNEGHGLEPGLSERAQGRLTIPCPGPVESLNAATAASVLLYEAARQRRADAGSHSIRRRMQ
jgi:RNA methyltransferase, TrmH family